MHEHADVLNINIRILENPNLASSIYVDLRRGYFSVCMSSYRGGDKKDRDRRSAGKTDLMHELIGLTVEGRARRLSCLALFPRSISSSDFVDSKFENPPSSLRVGEQKYYIHAWEGRGGHTRIRIFRGSARAAR